MARNEDEARPMFLDTEDGQFGNEEPNQSGSVWSTNAEVLERN